MTRVESDEPLITGLAVVFVISSLACWVGIPTASVGEPGDSSVAMFVGVAGLLVAPISGFVLLLFAVAAVRGRKGPAGRDPTGGARVEDDNPREE